jgi:two-component system KDP operon response regulator KdpE
MKVLIIEDDAEIIETVSLILKIRWPDCNVLSESSGARGLELVETAAPDLILLDLGLPDITGFNVLKQIRSFSTIPVIILTVRGEEKDIVTGLELGADDYVVKPFNHFELLARAQVAIRRSNGNEEQCPITYGNLRIGPSFSKLNYKGREITLTNTEGLLLYQLIKNAGNVLNYIQLAESVWGEDYPGVIDSIRVYIRRLRNKLEVDPNHPKLILTKFGIGYYLQKPK